VFIREVHVRFAGSIGALAILTSGCAQGAEMQTGAKDQRHSSDAEYHFVSEAGAVLVLNTQQKTLTAEDVTLRLVDCSDETRTCLVADGFKIAVPKSCPDLDDRREYISDKYGDIVFSSLDGLSGNIYKTYLNSNKFSYGYNFDNGVVSLIMLPDRSADGMERSGVSLAYHTYRVANGIGPYACKRAL